MPNQLTNLLPQSRRKALVREYRYRLTTVVISVLTTLLLIASALLLPTYVFLTGSANAKQTRLSAIQTTLTSNDEVSISARLNALSTDAAELSSLAAQPSPSNLIEQMLAVPHANVAILGFSYTPVQGKSPMTLSVTGLATTRDALRAYQLALQNAPFVLAANLPVASYAQDTDISFTITLTLKP